MSTRRGVCERCRVPFQRKLRGSNDAGRFCSRACAFEWLREEGKRRVVASMQARIIATERPCQHCGTAFTGRRNSLTCSWVCRRKRNNGIKLARATASRHAALPATAVCKECGHGFPRRRIKSDQNRYCSDACQRARKSRINYLGERRRGKTGTHAQRAKAFGVTCDRSITSFAVFDRADWHCQMCGIETPRDLKGTTDDQAPELDHVIPLSAGGGHVWSNVQCACRKCNGDKAARIPTDEERIKWASRATTPQTLGNERFETRGGVAIGDERLAIGPP